MQKKSVESMGVRMYISVCMCTLCSVVNVTNERYVFRKVDFKLNKGHHCKTYLSPVDERASAIMTVKHKYTEKTSRESESEREYGRKGREMNEFSSRMHFESNSPLSKQH